MGMTIDKAIDIMENYEEYGFLSQENGRNKAINIMRKYQKIEQAYSAYLETMNTETLADLISTII